MPSRAELSQPTPPPLLLPGVVVVVGRGVSLLSAQIRGFWGGQHDCRTGPGPEGLVPQVRSWETRARLWRVDGGRAAGRLAGGCRVGRLPSQLCCWGWKWPPLSSCLSGEGPLWSCDLYSRTFFQPETWISQLFKATRPPFLVLSLSHAPVLQPPTTTSSNNSFP